MTESQRERLLGRKLPPRPFLLRTEYTDEADEALAELDAARESLRIARRNEWDLGEYKARVEAAAAAYERYALRLLVHVIPPEEFEQLEVEHPPADVDTERGYRWNIATYMPALLEACVEGDMTAQDWAEVRTRGGAVAAGEINALFNLCLEANDRTLDVHLGKG